MKTSEEIKAWLLKNCVDKDGDLYLNDLDFSDFDGDIYLNHMRVQGNLFQDQQIVGGDLFQDHQHVGEHLYQGAQKVEGKIFQDEKIDELIKTLKELTKSIEENKDEE